MATTFKYLVIDVDGQVYGTDNEELAEFYQEHYDYQYVESSQLSELEETEDFIEAREAGEDSDD